jgi:hypothetical protein
MTLDEKKRQTRINLVFALLIFLISVHTCLLGHIVDNLADNQGSINVVRNTARK